MKPYMRFPNKGGWSWAVLLAACAAASKASAAETNAPAKTEKPLTPQEFFEGGKETYANWIEISGGGFVVDGNRSQFRQRHRSEGAFGGIEDFHYSTELAKKTTLTIDGRALYDNHDYKLRLDLTREKLGYLRFYYSELRTWYNADGGFDPASGVWYPSAESLALDRGEITFEGGLQLENKPQVAFKYTHRTRDGEKDSASWGIAHPPGPFSRPTIGVSPSFYDLDERSDSFQLDVTHKIKSTDIGLGARYDFGSLNNALKIHESPGEGAPAERKVTNRQETDFTLLNLHAFTETWLKKNLFLSTGYSFSDLDNDFSGSRIYGSDFDVSYVPGANSGAGYYGMNGSSHLQEHVANLNLMILPTPKLVIVPSVRVLKEDVDADAAGEQTLRTNPSESFTADSRRNLLDVTERLDLRYIGFTNWIFTARGEWTEGQGNVKELGGLGTIAGTGVPGIARETEDSRWFQKYSIGATWYATRRISLDLGAYYKNNQYDYDHLLDSTPNNSGNRYPAYLVMRNFETCDGSVRLTLRPTSKVTLVSRYEYQFSTIETTPDAVSGLGAADSSRMTSHIIAQNVSWTPWSRLYLQLGANYVFSEAHTPASAVTQSILDAQNNYWTLNASSGFVVDDKTDLTLGYFYYKTDNYRDISLDGVPYGAGSEEHGVTATLTRRLSKSVRLNVRYGFSHFADALSGDRKNFEAHYISSSLQYRF